MKKAKIVLFIGCIVFQSIAFALTIEVFNASGVPVNVKPLWSGGPKDMTLLSAPVFVKGQLANANQIATTYKSQLEQLNGLLIIPNNDRSCWYTYDLKEKQLWGTGSIKLTIGSKIKFGADNEPRPDFTSMFVQGYTDAVRKGGTAVKFEVGLQPGSCAK